MSFCGPRGLQRIVTDRRRPDKTPTPDPMDRFKTKRSARRAQNTKLLQEAKSLLSDPTTDKPKLTGIYDRFSASINELSKINDALEEHVADEELEAKYVAAAEYNDEAISMLAEIRCKIDGLRLGDSTAAAAPQNANTSPSEMPTAIGERLLNLGMPTFRGDIHEWSAFWEQYEQTVHLNNALSTTTKFYLCHYLTGEAAAAICGFPTSEACFADAIVLLEERFGDRKRIKQHHLSALRNLPHIKSGSDVRGLRRLYDAVQLNIRCATALNVPTLSFSAMLIDILQEALPYDIILAYTRAKRSQALRENGSAANVFEPSGAAATSDAELKELLTYTRVELESREQCKPFNDRLLYDRAQRTRSGSTSTAVVLQSTSSSWVECFFCKSKKHGTRACDANLAIDSEKEMPAKDNRCYRCTSRGPQARSRRVKLTCSSCHGRHASSMCDPHYTSNQTATPSRPVDSSGNTVGIMSSQSAMLCEKDSLSGGTTNHSEVYLQTLGPFVMKNGKTGYVRGILDEGSQRSFVTEDFAKTLHLQVLGETQIALNTFSCSSPSTVERRQVVEVPLRSQRGSDICTLRAIVVPVICQYIASPKADSHFVQNLRLESKVIVDEKKFDAETKNSLSLLIGADHLWQIMSGHIDKSEEVPGLVAIDTAFGWTLQRPSNQKAVLDCSSSLMVCILKVQAIGDDESTSQTLQSFWQPEAMGITDSTEPSSHESVARLHETISKKSTRYTVALPWKEYKKPLLGNNRKIPLSRLQRSTRRHINVGRNVAAI
ncbi:uncharacterized protein LOC142766061 [Rhipicephalus microplus]|uniref:uncharacterized protein LOC142766061 n=1 Tax=Rhipicephalus microplus TaxID=6941 RepID=UPI003F6AAEED